MDLSQALMQVGTKMADDVQVQGDVTILGRPAAEPPPEDTAPAMANHHIANNCNCGSSRNVSRSCFHLSVIRLTPAICVRESLIGDDLPLGDWFTGQGRTGLARFFVPLAIGLVVGG